MYLKSIYVDNFRNYEHLELELHPGINIIYGKNAQGKTNLLESIYVLGLTKSHRATIDNTLIREHENTAYIRGILFKEEISNQLEFGITNKKKLLKLNNNLVKRVSEYISNMNIIIFYPEDLELIKSSPAVRRRFMNMELSQLYSTYFDVLNDYNKLLKMRNDCLKQCAKQGTLDESYFEILNQYFVEKAVLLYKMRKKFIDRLNQHITKIFQDISDLDGFTLKYHTNLDLDSDLSYKNQLEQKLKKHMETERKMGLTLVGPHRDDIEFLLNNSNLKLYGSQGQQRMAVLALKLSEIELFKEYKKDTPILLLDDVFSELDEKKRNNLLKYIQNNTQTIITTTELELLNQKLVENSKLICIQNGEVIRTDEVKKNGRKN
ncbi:MAG: DNA replication/repair protein RecF [Firmicutes bacterium]|nr:DNA replication/repair protein RecF [Bacillota bacterium]